VLAPGQAVLDAVPATAKTCSGSHHALEPPKEAWTHRKAKMLELLPADPQAERF
jgi:hypothetical protein